MADGLIDDGTEESEGMRRRRFRRGVFVIPSLLTTANIFCGFYSVMESLQGMQALAFASLDPSDPASSGAIASATEHFDRAAINIGFAALFDLLDGRVARMTNATSEFGLELDSIADVVSFGIAPAVLAFAWGYGHSPELHKFAWAASFLFLICGALRLARFNVLSRQHKPNQPPKNLKADKKAFVGMPIPVAASMIAALAHFSPTPIGYVPGMSFSIASREILIGPATLSVALIVLVMSLAFLMVSTIKYSSFKNVGVGNVSPRILILGLALVVLSIWFYSRWALLILATAYASHGIIAKLWAMIKPRRAADRKELELDSKPQR
ncbi:MAG TPA: phosphatidylcholine/phosphatidylserine synthase [Blastocatellia bacterium]|jgi:CDP-diacylglycerol--serine O-phosphatidyltransferase